MITMQVPIPPRELSPNARVHWRRKAAAVAVYRRGVEMEALSVRPEHPYQRASVDVTYCIRGARTLGCWCPRDLDNALSAFKAGLDGLVDGGVLASDGHRGLVVGVEIDVTRGPYVEVTVTEVTP